MSQEKFDVFNALDLMDNAGILKDLHFGIGDGHLQYYLYVHCPYRAARLYSKYSRTFSYNWRCPDLMPAQIGLVLQ